MNCIVCLKSSDNEWSLQNPFYCCSAKFCNECDLELIKCPQCRSNRDPIQQNTMYLQHNPNFNVKRLIDIDIDIGVSFEWYTNHKLKLTVEYYDNGTTKSRYKYRDGMVDSDIPSYISYHRNSVISGKKWFVDGKLHRYSDLPAVISFTYDSKVEHLAWYKNGMLHRDNDLPAMQFYHKNGKIALRSWYKNGVSHRNRAPSTIYYNDDGTGYYRIFTNNGTIIDEGPIMSHSIRSTYVR